MRMWQVLITVVVVGVVSFMAGVGVGGSAALTPTGVQADPAIRDVVASPDGGPCSATIEEKRLFYESHITELENSIRNQVVLSEGLDPRTYDWDKYTVKMKFSEFSPDLFDGCVLRYSVTIIDTATGESKTADAAFGLEKVDGRLEIK